MVYPTDPDALYDQILGDKEYRDFIRVRGTSLPISKSVLDTLLEYTGQTEVELTRPDGTSHTLTGTVPIPDEDRLVEDLLEAQRAFGSCPVTTLDNLHATRVGPLHYSDETVHFTVSEQIFDAKAEGGTDSFPGEFDSLGVKTAHLLQGFQIADELPHHWIDDLGWSLNRDEIMSVVNGDAEMPDDRAPSADECFIVNVPTPFPAGSFGRTTSCPAVLTNQAIARTERSLDETLLTQRMAQLDAVRLAHNLIQSAVEQGHLDSVDEVDSVAQDTFDISESGLASLKSQMTERREKAFQTVRLLSDSDRFNYVIEEFADTIDEVGELAMLGTRYRKEIQDKPPGFY